MANPESRKNQTSVSTPTGLRVSNYTDNPMNVQIMGQTWTVAPKSALVWARRSEAR